MGAWIRRLFGGEAPPPADTAAAPAGRAATSSRATAIAVDPGLVFVNWLLEDGPGAQASAPDGAALAALDAAADDPRLPARVPRVPAVVPQLMQMLRDPTRSAADVARLVSHDAVLVAAVVRTSNSPWYGAGRAIESLDQAVLIVGHDGLRQIVASVAMKPLINVQSGRVTRTAAPRVWEQSEKAGAACRLLAPVIGGNAFEAFLAALLANMGTTLALRVLDDQPGAGSIARSPPACARFASVSARLAVRVGEHWGFAPTVLAMLESDTESASATLRHAAEHVSRLRVLVDGGRLAQADATAILGEDTPLRRGFEALAR